MKKVLSVLMFLMFISNLNAEVTVEFKWFSQIGLNENTFSPQHTYGVGDGFHRNKLYEITEGKLIFEVDTTKDIITDYTGKTFFVIDSINQTFTASDIESKDIIKELTYRDYLRNRAVSDSRMFELDVENQILRLWNIYDDILIGENDLKMAENYPDFPLTAIIKYTYDGRFINFGKFYNSYIKTIFDCNNNEFIKDIKINEPYNLPYKFYNHSNILVYHELMKTGNDSVECNYLRFYNLETRTYFKDVKIISFKKIPLQNEIGAYIISTDDKYILFEIPADFFYDGAHGLYIIDDDKFQEKKITLENMPVYFSSSFIVVIGNSGYRVKTPTSISYSTEKIESLIYPNPSVNYITLSESDTKLYKGYEIYDISGRLLQKSILGSYRIDISTLERGSYYLRLLSPSGIATAGFLKME